MENASVEKVLLFETDSSPSGHAVKVFDVCANGVCSCVYNLSGDNTQLKPCRFAYILSLCSQEGKEKFTPLFHDVCDGFKIVDEDFNVSTLSYDCKNYLSVLTKENKPKMDKIISNELSEGFMKIVKRKPKCIHSLGAVPKPDGGIRPITDCSMPLHDSVNSHCENLIEEFKYKSVENVLSMLNIHDYLAVVDIKAAYRALSIYPDHRSLLGLRWNLDNKEIYIEDGRMCFGLRVGPMQFNKVSEFIYSILSDLYGIQIVNYLDDFIVVASTKEEAQWAQSMVINILRYVGFHISWAKVTPPSQVCRFLGLEIDSNEMEIRLPVDKLEKLKGLLAKYINKNSIGKKELESLGGLLSHCAHVVDGGRVYSRRFYDLYKVILKHNLKSIKLGKMAREDLMWWSNFCESFNGKRKIEYVEYPYPIVSDSSMKGFAIYKNQDWLAGSWEGEISLDTECNHIVPPPILDNYDPKNINELELWPILVGVKTWLSEIKYKSVQIYTDNTQVFHMIRKGVSSNATCMEWLRELFWVCKIYKIRLVPHYINTKNNLVADTLSRILYIKSEAEIRRCLEGSNLCCLDPLFKFCRG